MPPPLDPAGVTRHIPPPLAGTPWTSKVFDISGKRVWVAGHRGMVGAAVVRRLATVGCEILTVGREEVDLTRQAEIERWLDKARPDAIVMAAAKVGGIHANSTLPADFLFINLMIGANVVNAAHRAGVKRLVNLGSSCMYPVGAPQPIAEASVGNGRPEPTNEAYAVAKLATASLAGDLSQAVRRRLRHRDPDQPLRSGRQFRSDDEPRRAGHDAAHDRGARCRARPRSRSGARASRAAS